jgi:hypothetical protein
MDRAYNINGGEEEWIEDIGGKARRKIPLGRPRCRWMHNIKMNLTDVRWGGIDWIELAHGRDQWRNLANNIMNLPVH